MGREQLRGRFAWMALAAVVLLLSAVIGLICVLLLKAQDAYRHAAAYGRVRGQAGEALRQMAAELADAGNIRVSPDGMAMTFQLAIQLDMHRLGQYLSHGSAPPAPGEAGWKPFDVNGDGRIDARDVSVRDGNGHVFWGAKETVGDVWGNFMCYQFQHLDDGANGRPDMSDCLDESRIEMDINGDGEMDDVFLPGELIRFSTTEGDPAKAPEKSMTSLHTALIETPTWVIVRWDKARKRIAFGGQQDLNSNGKVDGPAFREMVWWRSKPLNHPLRKPPDSAPGLWDIWRDYPRPKYRHGSVMKVDLWLLRITIDRRPFLAHVTRDIKLQKG